MTLLQIESFRPFVYSKGVKAFWSPPFDTIHAEYEKELKANEHNITHLTLPRGSDGVSIARRTFERWVSSGVLHQLEENSIILTSQSFIHDGQSLTRNGLLSLVRVYPENGSIKPHEGTFEGPRKDRIDLMKGIGLIPEPIFLVVPGVSFKASVDTFIAHLNPDFTFEEPKGVVNSFFIVNDRNKIAQVATALQNNIAVVADGHHRLAAVKEIAAEKGGSWDYTLAYTASINDPALLISGIHRLVRKKIDVTSFMTRAKTLFDIQEVTGASKRDITVFDGKRYLSLKPIPSLAKKLDLSVPEDLATVVRKGLLEKCADFGSKDIEQEIEYTHEVDHAVTEVVAGRASVAILMPDWEKERFLNAVSRGNLLSQKATFFYPKIPSGIAIYRP